MSEVEMLRQEVSQYRQEVFELRGMLAQQGMQIVEIKKMYTNIVKDIRVLREGENL